MRVTTGHTVQAWKPGGAQLQPQSHREDLEMVGVQTAPPMDGCGLAHPSVFLLFLLSFSTSSNPSTYPALLTHSCAAAIIHWIIHTCAPDAVTCQRVLSGERSI